MTYGLPLVDHSRLPDELMTDMMAHHQMQLHLECPITICPVKRQAKAHLVEARRLVPADAPHVGS